MRTRAIAKASAFRDYPDLPLVGLRRRRGRSDQDRAILAVTDSSPPISAPPKRRP